MTFQKSLSIPLVLFFILILLGIEPREMKAELISPSLEGHHIKNEPQIEIETPKKFCKLDRGLEKTEGYRTGYEPGLKSGTSLVALFVPCHSLDAAEKRRIEWLPEWVAYEKNTVTFPSDNASTLGTRGAVKQLCKDARLAKYGHPTYENQTLPDLVVEAHERLTIENPVIFFGVIHEEESICYLSSLRLLFSPSGRQQRFLLVTAFMQTGDRWIYQTLRREVHAAPKGSAQAEAVSVLEESKLIAQAFVKNNS